MMGFPASKREMNYEWFNCEILDTALATAKLKPFVVTAVMSFQIVRSPPLNMQSALAFTNQTFDPSPNTHCASQIYFLNIKQGTQPTPGRQFRTSARFPAKKYNYDFLTMLHQSDPTVSAT